MIISDSSFAENIPAIVADGKKWVVAVSGGADSMCLALLAKEFVKERGIELYACFIDHCLRDDSARDIEIAISTLQTKGFSDCHVLRWHHEEDIGGNLEMKARKARYSLLLNFCRENGADYLFTAHHSLDQWETFFMRLSRGSALSGLSCIKPISRMENIFVIRPFLNYTPTDIKETLIQRFGVSEYFHDPMNEQTKFERVRWRKAYPHLAAEYGLSTVEINKSIRRLQLSEECLEYSALNLIAEIFDGQYLDFIKFKKQHLEMRVRILRILIKKNLMSYDLLKRTAILITEDGFHATNLGGIVITRDKTKNLRIQREKRKRLLEPQT
ncbi:MAG: tRNA lysidine(34) synthetase TilS [Holosporales bacterium]|jgi:tRNA(Ile)-lysidine synthetase-like protein|nr:tRNA lysidine(34) synthetase TilS [Holosporales bacterium]